MATRHGSDQGGFRDDGDSERRRTRLHRQHAGQCRHTARHPARSLEWLSHGKSFGTERRDAGGASGCGERAVDGYRTCGPRGDGQLCQWVVSRHRGEYRHLHLCDQSRHDPDRQGTGEIRGWHPEPHGREHFHRQHAGHRRHARTRKCERLAKQHAGHKRRRERHLHRRRQPDLQPGRLERWRAAQCGCEFAPRRLERGEHRLDRRHHRRRADERGRGDAYPHRPTELRHPHDHRRSWCDDRELRDWHRHDCGRGQWQHSLRHGQSEVCVPDHRCGRESHLHQRRRVFCE